jgi:hypothetical protein
MTMQVMGIQERELTTGIEVAGAASCLVDASQWAVSCLSRNLVGNSRQCKAQQGG